MRVGHIFVLLTYVAINSSFGEMVAGLSRTAGMTTVLPPVGLEDGGSRTPVAFIASRSSVTACPHPLCRHGWDGTRRRCLRDGIIWNCISVMQVGVPCSRHTLLLYRLTVGTRTANPVGCSTPARQDECQTCQVRRPRYPGELRDCPTSSSCTPVALRSIIREVGHFLMVFLEGNAY